MKAHFEKIISELERRPLPTNRDRKTTGVGKTQVFGVVNRRCCKPDYSVMCWERPLLYLLLLEFGKHFISIPWNTITVNQNYQCGIHRDKNNSGDSVLVAFGNFSGGDLEIHEGNLKGIHNIKHTLFQTDFSNTYHSVLPFQGDRYSLVFYYYPTETELPPPSVKFENGQYVFYRGSSCERLNDHPLKNRIITDK